MQNTQYVPSDIETPLYREWEAKGYFKPSMNMSAPAFSIQLPPPNVTGTLHMGHAFNQTVMDALTRYHRMQGENVCWIPGSDHAGIATQIVVERQLTEQGTSRHDLGRDAFVDRIWAWKEESGSTITTQMRRMGCSADWSREYFTMDEARAHTVTEIFVRLYEQGLIYRGKRLVNWDPVLGTAVSDLEVESVEERGHMWHIRYPLAGNAAQSLTIATTRPETLLGDVAVAVHPDDERYTGFIGKEVVLPLTGRTIPVIADTYVDKEFGTGCVKITPAHDFNDYEVGKRHQTPLISVMDLKAKIRKEAEVSTFNGDTLPPLRLPEAYAGLDRFAARKAVIADLQDGGFLVKTEDHTLMTPKGDRTGSVIEPMLTSQWFVAMSQKPAASSASPEPESEYKGMSLAEKCTYAVASGQVRFIPENWVNTYNRWMENIQDWCISRQLWWGHRIPAWYDENGNIFVARTEEDARRQAGEDARLSRDEDVLDTWFSSALVPFSTLGWPEDTPELKAFLPSNVLVTGYEIIFFWVARMVMMTTHFTGKVPFDDVYIHGMVRDHDGKKMSKSEGNVIDPVDLIDGIGLPELLVKRTAGLRRPETAPAVRKATEKLFPQGIPSYGADALRFTMASYASLGRSINFDFKRAEGYRNFCNKLWNAARFVLMNMPADTADGQSTITPVLAFPERWILSALQKTISDVTEALNTYRLDIAAQLLYEFAWNEYCDWYLETAKVGLQSSDAAVRAGTQQTMARVLETLLRLIHPIMPFITETLWQNIAPCCDKKTGDTIMLAAWPQADAANCDTEAEDKMSHLKELAGIIRNVRTESGIGPGVKVPLYLEEAPGFADFSAYLAPLTRLSAVHLVMSLPEDRDAPAAVFRGKRLMLKIEVDKAAENARLSKELEKLQKKADKLSGKLSQPGYTAKAPAPMVEKDRAELAELREKIAGILRRLQ